MADYTDRTKVDTIFGSDNVDKWSDLDNDADATKITNRINDMLTQASREFDSDMREGPYDVDDFTSTEPLLEHYVGIKAGLLLYELRGTEDTDAEGGVEDRFSRHRNMYRSFVKALHTGIKRLDQTIVALRSKYTVPKVWTETELDEVTT